MTKQEILQRTSAFLLDLDGTVYVDEVPIRNVVSTLRALRRLGKRIVFLTNNSSRTRVQYEEKLTRVGVFEGGDLVYTSGMATVAFLRENYPGKRVYLLGTEALRAEFQCAGVQLCEESPDVCVLAYDVELTFEKIRKFDSFLRRGAHFLATHPDDVCPAKDGSMPDVGSFLALFERSSGRRPERIIGKPYADMANGIVNLTKLSSQSLCMVGDRMYTDIRFANQNGLLSVLVLSGETTRALMSSFPDRPDLVLDCLDDLLEPV